MGDDSVQLKKPLKILQNSCGLEEVENLVY